MDGGVDALLVPCIGLNHLSGKLDFFDNFNYVNQWIDGIVACGDSSLIGALLAEGKSDIFERSLQLENLVQHQNKGFTPELTERFFGEQDTLASLRKNFMFLSYDMEVDESYVFSSINPLVQNVPINNVLKATMGDSFANQYLKFQQRKLSNASYFVPSPIFHAANFANCLYFDEPTIFVSIGAGSSEIETERDKVTALVHKEFQEEIKNNKKWHYFRFNPVLPNEATVEEKMEIISDFFTSESHSMDRLLRLMEIKAGKIF